MGTTPTPTQAGHEIHVDPKTFKCGFYECNGEIWQLCNANCKNISVAQQAHTSASMDATSGLKVRPTSGYNRAEVPQAVTYVQLTLYGHIKSAEQRTIIQQYGDWYTGR